MRHIINSWRLHQLNFKNLSEKLGVHVGKHSNDLICLGVQIKHFIRPLILVKLATYKMSWSAFTGQSKSKQTQLVGCKFD